jgi:hypothetical protein
MKAAGNPRLPTADKLRLRCATLTSVVRALQPLYADPTNLPTQRDLIETLIGAAVWYLPSLKQQLWTGHISVNAVRSCSQDAGSGPVRLSEEHLVPRKIAGAELLSRDWAASVDQPSWLELEFLGRFGRFCYVTPKENKELTKLQKAGIFQTAADAYSSAGLEFVKADAGQLRRLRRRDGDVVRELIDRPRELPT